MNGAQVNGMAMASRITAPQDFDDHDEQESTPLRLVEGRAEASVETAPTAPAPQETEVSRDRQAAAELVRMVQDFNRAMDEAKRSGLIIEPSLSTVQSQFGGDGAAGHLLSIKVFRKLC